MFRDIPTSGVVGTRAEAQSHARLISGKWVSGGKLGKIWRGKRLVIICHHAVAQDGASPKLFLSKRCNLTCFLRQYMKTSIKYRLVKHLRTKGCVSSEITLLQEA